MSRRATRLILGLFLCVVIAEYAWKAHTAITGDSSQEEPTNDR